MDGNCLKIELISRYVDNELNPEERKRIELHISACPACREAVNELSSLNNNIRQSGVCERLPAGFEQRFYARAGEVSKKQAVFFPRLAWAGVGAAAILLFAVLVGPKLLPGWPNSSKGGSSEEKILNGIAKDSLNYL